MGNALSGSVDLLADADAVSPNPRAVRLGVPREGDGGRVGAREREGVPGSEN